MKKLTAGLFGTALLLAACGGGGDDGGNEAPAENNNTGGNNTEEEAADNGGGEDEGEYDLANGEELYQGNCASCHGGDLSGGTGPSLQDAEFDQVTDAISSGPGSMPADLVEGSDAEDVAAWVSDQ
ncbi:c-type cytochrome [Alkalicoccus urumqiensis]|uniref:Cytochrome C551 n=1 Tax=Alkalicoccus urumqiensis TaxID=1548213 RepID=A0A2P6MH91_ALKUR|nr:cytochrome c [Alkalicoccus urumqiensis]PRO65610.1 cytochrome C551 [Alkalicoccus urumqiensis]